MVSRPRSSPDTSSLWPITTQYVGHSLTAFEGLLTWVKTSNNLIDKLGELSITHHVHNLSAIIPTRFHGSFLHKAFLYAKKCHVTWHTHTRARAHAHSVLTVESTVCRWPPLYKQCPDIWTYRLQVTIITYESWQLNLLSAGDQHYIKCPDSSTNCLQVTTITCTESWQLNLLSSGDNHYIKCPGTWTYRLQLTTITVSS